MKHKFGKKVDRWFTQAALLKAETKEFDQDTNTMKNTEDDELNEILPEKDFVRSPANINAHIQRGYNLSDLEIFDKEDDEMSFGNDSDEDELNNEIVEFDLDEMFKSLPAVMKAPGRDDESHHSFNTAVTSTAIQESVHSYGTRGSVSSKSVSTNAQDASLQQTGVNGFDE